MPMYTDASLITSVLLSISSNQTQSTVTKALIHYVIHDKPTVEIPFTFNRKESLVTLVTVYE